MQDIPDRTWDDDNNQTGLNTQIRGALPYHADPVTAAVTDFFGGDVIGPSFIPEESQAYAYNFASGSQQGLQTPPPAQESQTQEAEVQYGRGFRVPQAPNRLSLSGRKERPGGRRRLG